MGEITKKYLVVAELFFFCFILLMIIPLSWALAEKPSRQTAVYNEVHAINENSGKAIGKDKFNDRDDFYFLNTGKKASFLRKEKEYLIIHDKKRVTSSILSKSIKSLFGARLDIVTDHPLNNFIMVRIKKGEHLADILSALRQTYAAISFISPVLKSSVGGIELAVAPEIIVSIDDAFDPDNVITELQDYNLTLVSKLAFTDSEYEMKINETVSDIGRIFELTRTVAELPSVNWAEPNFMVSVKKQFMPDDTLFNDQWHLHNTGQSGGAVDADIDAPEGWDYSRGNGAIISIYDDGVDISHEDLNIWSNPGETGGGKETNGVDDDGNGYIDDYQGWDFSDNDNDPSPSAASDNHGTAVTGVAGAIGNNNKGVSGSAQEAAVLPVRMTSGFCTMFADAMRYAGKYSDVVNNSWSIDACISNLNVAISDVVNGNIAGARRGTKGTPVLFAAGNNASGWRKYTLTGFSTGTYSFRWRFSKDRNVSQGYDTVWLDDITWPGGTTTDFESDTVGNVPNDFTSSGNATWAVVSDGIHARGASGKSVKAGTISRNQKTDLNITKTVGNGTLIFWVWVSSEQNYDFWKFYVNNILYFQYAPGQYGHANEVGYPASNPDTIAVGASDDGGKSGLEERTYYSQFGPEVDVVAPSSGGGQGITTTDRMGSLGYDLSNYTSTFGGTSSATPLVAGIVADIISNDSSMTAAEVRTELHLRADKIGPYAYIGGRNDYYGYGRANLLNSFPDITVIPLNIDFGNVNVGNYSDSTVTVSNDGNGSLEIGTVTSPSFPFSVIADTCSGQMLAFSETCSIDIRFEPTDTVAYSDSFDIPSNDPDENPVTVNLNGTGINNAPSAHPNGPYTEVEGQSLILDGSGSSDSDGSIVLYEWDIDNNGTYEYSSALPTQSHAYAQQGTSTIKLRVTDNLGATDVATTTANISDTSPTADFTGSPTSGTGPLTVNFTNNSTGYDQPLTYEWDFDNDGTIDSTALNPSYTYNNQVTYTVKLTVTDSDGSTNILIRTDYIDVTLSGCSNPPVRNDRTSEYYSTLQAAYNDPATMDGDTIQSQAIVLTEDLSMNRDISVIIEGGYDCDYTTIIGRTILNGDMTITNGTLNIRNFILE